MKKLNQILSLTLSSAMMLTSAPWPAAAMGPVAEMPAFAQALAPAESLGYIATSYSPSADVSRPRLIVIADLHAHVEVQHHIVDMLDGLVNKLTTGPAAQKQVPIFVEGGWQSHLEHPLASVKNAKLRSIMAEYFLQKSEIPATQAFSERHPNATNFTLTGVENKDEYEANRARFLSSYPVRKRLLEAIARHEDTLKDLSGSAEAHSYQKMQDMRKAYQTGSLTGDRYARALVHQASRFNIENRFVQVLRGANPTANAEFDLALTDVSRLVSAKLAESRPLSAFFRGDEKTARENIATVDAYLDLLKRTLGNQLTPEEVPFAYARIPQMTQVAQIMLSSESLNIDIPNALQQSLAFYPFAFMRNDSLIENSLTNLQKGSPSDTGILVVGGFHSEAISQYLQDHQIPYLLINPIVSRDLSTAEQLNYVERVAGDHVTKEEVRADFAHPWGQAITTRASTSITPISDMADPVDPATTDGVIKKTEGEADSFTGAANPAFYAGLTVADQLGLDVVKKTSGFSMIANVENTVVAETALSILSNANVPFEAKIDPAYTASFVPNDAGVYTATGRLADELTIPFAAALHTIRESGTTLKTPPIYVVGVHQAILGAYAVRYGGIESATKTDQTNYLTVSQNGKVVILYNVDAPKGSSGPEHEFTHALTGNRDEVAVQTIALKSFGLRLAAQAAGTSVEHALTLGLSATSVPTRVVLSKLWGIRNEIPGANLSGLLRLGGQLFSASKNGAVSLQTFAALIDNVVSPDAATRVADAQVAAMKVEFMKKFSDLPSSDIDAAFAAAEPMTVAGFAFGSKSGMLAKIQKSLESIRRKSQQLREFGRQA